MPFDPNSPWAQPNQQDASGFMPDFMTPGQIQQQREYAKALRDAAMTGVEGHSGQFTAVSPLSPLVAGLRGAYGGYEMGRAGQADQYSMNAPGKDIARLPIPGNPGAGYGGYAGGAEGGTNSAIGYAAATQGQESGGKYDAIGPTTRDGDHAYGAYQVKGENIGPWTQEILGVALTPQQFLASKEAQDLVYQKKFGEYVQKYGPEGAARAWYGGEGNVNNPNARDLTNPNAPTVGQYGQQFSQRLAQNGGPALGFSGEPGEGSGAAPDAPAAISMALRGGPQGGPPLGQPGMPQAAPAGPQGAPPSGFFMQRQRMDPATFAHLYNNPYLTPAQKELFLAQYQGQFQPVQMQAPFGGSYVQDARGNTLYIPGQLQNQHTTVGRISTERPYWVDPSGQQHILGGGGGAVTQGPKASGANIPPATGYDIGGGGNDIGGGKPQAAQGPRSEAEPQAAPNQVAALEGGTANDAPVPGVLGTPPPSAGPALANKPPNVQTAQAGDGGNIAGMSDQQLVNLNQKMDLAEKRSDADLKRYNDNLEKFQNAARDARTALPQIELAQQLFNDKRLIQGPWANFKQAFTNTFTALNLSDQARVSTSLANEVDKLVSSGILNTMRQTLSGLGQIRLAEINLLQQASASRYNTPEANSAILFLTQRLAQRATDIGKISSDYDQGVRWDESGKRTTSNADDIPTNTGLNAAIQTYMNNHPTLNDKEETQLHDMLTTTSHTGRPKPKAAAGAPSAADAKAELDRRRKAAAPAQ